MNKKILCIAIFFLVFFYGFSREVKKGFFKQTDFNFTVRIQDRMPKRFDEVWEDAAFFVTPVFSVVFVGLLTIVAFRRGKFRAILIPLLFGLLVMGEIYGKSVVHHPAPPFFMIKNPTTIFPKYYINEQFSYPSGHTARAAFLGIVFSSLLITHSSLRKKKKLCRVLSLGIVGYICMVAIGRIYLGHHWLSDIIGGGLLGSGFGLLTVYFNDMAFT